MPEKSRSKGSAIMVNFRKGSPKLSLISGTGVIDVGNLDRQLYKIQTLTSRAINVVGFTQKPKITVLTFVWNVITN